MLKVIPTYSFQLNRNARIQKIHDFFSRIDSVMAILIPREKEVMWLSTNDGFKLKNNDLKTGAELFEEVFYSKKTKDAIREVLRPYKA